jgi:phosphoglycolate phosphatase
MVKHIVFDFDGTLADSEEVCFQLLNEIGARHRYRQIDREELREIKRLAYPDRLRELGVPITHVPFLAIEARREYRAKVASLNPFPGVREALLRLKASGFVLHVLSSNAVPSIRDFLVTHGMDVFKTINCERNFFGKHIGLKRFLRTHDLNQEDVIYLADEVRDVEACRKIDLTIISVAWGFDPAESLISANPEFTAHTPADAVQMLEAMVPRRVADTSLVLR